MSYKVASVDSALTVLEAVAENPGVGVTRLAELTGKTKSQVFRLLYTLEARGYLVKDAESSSYNLGYQTILLGEAAKRQTDLVRLALPIMKELTEETSETSHLIIRDGLHSLCVAIVEGPLPVRLYARVGRRGPLHAGGGSKVMLAYAPDDVIEQVLSSELERHTDATITDRSELEEVLEQIRRDGYHVAISDVDEGAFSVAAPIRDHLGNVVAAVTVAGPETRLTAESGPRLVEAARRAAAKVSRLLGYTGEG